MKQGFFSSVHYGEMENFSHFEPRFAIHDSCLQFFLWLTTARSRNAILPIDRVLTSSTDLTRMKSEAEQY